MSRFHQALFFLMALTAAACDQAETPDGTAPRAPARTPAGTSLPAPSPTPPAVLQTASPTPEGQASPTPPRSAPTPAPQSTATPLATRSLEATPAPTGASPAPPPPPARYDVERVFPQLTFDRLTAIEHQAVAGVSRLFVLEQAGRALSFPLGPGAPEASVFLDISSRVYTSHNEEGLLGLAFDPAFQSNGYLYVYYSASPPRRNVLSRFTASADRLSADPGSELIILESPKPFGNHNGGQIAFGPDGHLYIGIGDGGGSGDPEGHGQNTGDLLGSILRMDVRNAAVGAPYAIPPDNPFASKTGARGEIWAYGLRNPWRFSFDQQGRLWIADVGQFNREEIDLGVKGANYGWPIVEGTRCFSQSQSACTRNDLTGPIWEYTHEEGCSVTGGYVLADPRLPWLHGAYIAADFCSGKVWAVRYENGKAEATELVDTSLGITTFGLGPDGTLYIGSRSQGLYRLVPA